MSSDLPPPAVAADLYDEAYFRGACGGSSEWNESGGAAFAGIYAGCLLRAGLRPGEVVVDIGTGRGELVAEAVRRGAGRAVGIEYSNAAVKLARRTLEVHGVADKGEILHADARRIPLEDGSCDLVTLLDVVEHLAPDELDRTLREAARILRPGGRILIHTFPNRSIYDVTYRVLRGAWPPWRRSWPADPRNDYERTMHVNEQTVSSLGRAMRNAGFDPSRSSAGAWVYTDFVPSEGARAAFRLLARVPGVRRWVVGDIWGEGRTRMER